MSEADARLFVLLARAAPRAVVLRRGPSKRVCSIGWDLRDDSFEVGQWLAGRIYERKSDISPDGAHWLYFALNGRWDEPTRGAYTVLARAPYLKALGLWPNGDTWGGGGLFSASGRRFWPFHDAPLIAPAPPPAAHASVVSARWYTGVIHHSRLLRDGWSAVSAPSQPSGGGEDAGPSAAWGTSEATTSGESSDAGGLVRSFTREAPGGWLLRQDCELRSDRYSLSHASERRLLACPGWEWAEVDAARERVVWAESGCLYAARLDRTGLVARALLQDLNPLIFRRIRAPY